MYIQQLRDFGVSQINYTTSTAIPFQSGAWTGDLDQFIGAQGAIVYRYFIKEADHAVTPSLACTQQHGFYVRSATRSDRLVTLQFSVEIEEDTIIVVYYSGVIPSTRYDRIST